MQNADGTCRGITYRNTKTDIPNWTDALHEKQPFGIAYETANHFVHYYCADAPWHQLSIGLTAVQGKQGNLREWCVSRFGAQDIRELKSPVGTYVQQCWRPGLDSIAYDTNPFRYDKTLDDALQALGLLLKRL